MKGALARLRRRSIIPGFGLTLGFTIFYLSAIVLVPLAATFVKTSSMGWPQFWHVVTTPRAVASYELSFGASLIGAMINFVMGTLVAWVLVATRFPESVFWTRSWTCRSRCRRPSPASR